MAGPIAFAAIQVFLFGITNAQCPVQCNDAKKISGNQWCGYPPINCDGIWHLKDPESEDCPQEWPAGGGHNVSVCKYRRNKDGVEMCFCDPGTPPNSIDYVEASDWQLALCFDDTNTPKLFPSIVISLLQNSYANCMAECVAACSTCTYFGLEDGTKCYCGNDEPPTSTHPQVSQNDCNAQACPGSPLTSCGDTNKIKVYAIPKRLPAWLGGGCYDDSILSSPGLSDMTSSVPGNSYFNCMEECAGYTNKYFGLKNGNECWCDLPAPSLSDQRLQALCFSTCTGDALTTCGGPNHVQVYAIQDGR